MGNPDGAIDVKGGPHIRKALPAAVVGRRIQRRLLHRARSQRLGNSPIIAIVPFVMLLYFGFAVIIDDMVDQRFGWPPDLPLRPPWQPEIFAGAVIYIGLTLWLWWRWRKLRAD
jgi:hypothetical protein